MGAIDWIAASFPSTAVIWRFFVLVPGRRAKEPRDGYRTQ